MDQKLKNTAEQLARQVECAKEAGIYDSMFIAFGTLLGHVRHGGSMIPGDDDIDVGFILEDITPEQQGAYYKLLGQPTAEWPDKGLFKYREHVTRRQDNKGFFWMSVRGRPDEKCFKCCHWFFWEKYGYMWHSKGPGSFVKGAPASYFGKGPEVEFLGVNVRVPKMAGALLDFWYTDWFTKRMGGNSAKKVLMKNVNWQTMAGDVEETGRD